MNISVRVLRAEMFIVDPRQNDIGPAKFFWTFVRITLFYKLFG
jgi:hypothetical protein